MADSNFFSPSQSADAASYANDLALASSLVQNGSIAPGQSQQDYDADITRAYGLASKDTLATLLQDLNLPSNASAGSLYNALQTIPGATLTDPLLQQTETRNTGNSEDPTNYATISGDNLTKTQSDYNKYINALNLSNQATGYMSGHETHGSEGLLGALLNALAEGAFTGVAAFELAPLIASQLGVSELTGGMIGGSGLGAISSAAHGSNPIVGAITGGAGSGIAGALPDAGSTFGNVAKSVGTGSALGAVNSALTGGNIGLGALTGAASGAAKGASGALTNSGASDIASEAPDQGGSDSGPTASTVGSQASGVLGQSTGQGSAYPSTPTSSDQLVSPSQAAPATGTAQELGIQGTSWGTAYPSIGNQASQVVSGKGGYAPQGGTSPKSSPIEGMAENLGVNALLQALGLGGGSPKTSSPYVSTSGASGTNDLGNLSGVTSAISLSPGTPDVGNSPIDLASIIENLMTSGNTSGAGTGTRYGGSAALGNTSTISKPSGTGLGQGLGSTAA